MTVIFSESYMCLWLSPLRIHVLQTVNPQLLLMTLSWCLTVKVKALRQIHSVRWNGWALIKGAYKEPKLLWGEVYWKFHLQTAPPGGLNEELLLSCCPDQVWYIFIFFIRVSKLINIMINILLWSHVLDL